MWTARPRLFAQTEQAARHKNFVHRMPEVAAAQVVVLLRQGEVAAAAQIAQAYDLPLSQARVLLAQGDSAAALAILEAVRKQMEAKHWQDETAQDDDFAGGRSPARMATRTRPCKC